MPLTPETLIRHELNGLYTEVVDSPNPDLVGVAGRVVVETMHMLHLDDGVRVRQVPKEGTTFEFRLPIEDADETADIQPTDTVGDAPTVTDSRSSRRVRTDEAAEAAKASGTASKLVSSSTQSATDADSNGESVEAARTEAGEGVAYVTVDGTQLLSRPALRTENAGESTWR